MKRKISVLTAVVMVIAAVLVLTSCSSDDEEKKHKSKNDLIAFDGVEIDPVDDLATMAKRMTDNGVTVFDDIQYRLYDKNGELTEEKAFRDGIPVSDKMLDVWQPQTEEDSEYEFLGYYFSRSPQLSQSIQLLKINGKDVAGLTEESLSKYADPVHAWENDNPVYTEVYIDGEKVELKESDDGELDEDTINGILSQYKEGGLDFISILPMDIHNTLAAGRAPFRDYTKAAAQSEGLMNSTFLAMRINEFRESKSDTLCIIYYYLEKGEITKVKITMVQRKA